MKKSILMGMLTAAVVFAGQINAATFNVDSLTGAWNNADPGSINSNIVTAPDGSTSSVTWGSGSMGPSGYVFEVNPHLDSVTTGVQFELGTFTHNNFPIRGTTLERINLDVGLDLSNGGVFSEIFTFSFKHNETPNNEDPSTHPDNNDIVTFGFDGAPINGSSFDFGGGAYTLFISFDTPSGSQFSTVETKSNYARLFGVIDVAPAPIPETSTYLLLGTCLGFAGLMHRRRQAQADKVS